MRRLGTNRRPLGALALAGAIAAPLLAGGVARADVIPLADMMHGIRMTQQQCAATPSTVWVSSALGGFCMRYYLSVAGGDGRWATVFLQGDKLGRGNLRTRVFSGDPKQKDIDTADLQKVADAFSRKTKGPAIYLARIGVDGSSGYHIVRHSVLELEVTNAALTGIKLLHRYQGFHLVGQSGGATLVGGLLAMRQDIGCAVPGSGRLAAVTKTRTKSSDLAVSNFEPSDMLAMIARNRARILVVTDPQDHVVPWQDQAAFVERLRRAGGQAEQFFVQAIDDEHHGTVAYAGTAVAACIRGDDNQAIARELADLVRRRVASAQREKEQRMGQAAAPQRPQPNAGMPPPQQPARTSSAAPLPGHQASMRQQ